MNENEDLVVVFIATLLLIESSLALRACGRQAAVTEYLPPALERIDQWGARMDATNRVLSAYHAWITLYLVSVFMAALSFTTIVWRVAQTAWGVLR